MSVTKEMCVNDKPNESKHKRFLFVNEYMLHDF